jgi:hypothetical protein
MAFSNTPGPLKTLMFKGPGEKTIDSLHSQSYMMVGGNMGMALCAISNGSRIRLSLNSDDAVMNDEDNRKFMMYIYNNI